MNSVKPFGEILKNAASWPSQFHWENYSKAWELARFSEAFRNSVIITVISVILITLFSAMAAYRMVRADTKFNRLLLLLFVAAMVVPFQTIMIPVLKVVNTLGVNNSILGLLLTNLGLSLPLAVFLFHGFVKSVPLEIEEAATVDGCNPFTVFFRIVLPLLEADDDDDHRAERAGDLERLFAAVPDFAKARAADHSAGDLFVLRAIHETMGHGASGAGHRHSADRGILSAAAALHR